MSRIRKDKLRKLKNLTKTSRKSDFAILRNNFKERLSILSQGDSWFAYPHKNFLGNAPNLIRHLSKSLKRKVNFYTMAVNWDEAVEMISGHKKHEIINVVRWHLNGKGWKPLDLILFSGGGNDLVGTNDFERFLFSKKVSFTKSEDYINFERLNRKVQQIGLAYHELIDIRDHYSPDTIIMTHT
jgi:hypothetical protein